MPSGHPHLGHLMVMKEVVWHVQQGGNGLNRRIGRQHDRAQGLLAAEGEQLAHQIGAALRTGADNGKVGARVRI